MARDKFHYAVRRGLEKQEWEITHDPLVLEEVEPERTLYLAIPSVAYDSFFWRDLPKLSIQRYDLKLIVYEPEEEIIIQWIN
ncbi:element excision factor XisH family protein [Roseofilum sp. BLCC_M154]|uniref:Element excision factor XisH family protein n=1 Tax=Roseofilum acuticapitatum BLCC-M154 TaxID=3022444 RepID=A0ABT7AWK7_9CYAN|nr:element excision factor XisH family protein [Roseofilum acuticapitatum]MDJ1170661.1 element excision factor XisH family protein [Roseofilum acuticapitatum BLCC-M154]